MPLEAGKKLILAFVTLIIGVLLLASASTETSSKTSKSFANNETISIASARNASGNLNYTVTIPVTNLPTTWKIEDCPITGFVYRNQSGQVMSTPQHYNFSGTTGLLQVAPVTVLNGTTSNTTAADYTYCSNEYVNSGFGRSALNITTGMFAIAILLVSVGLFFSIAKDYDFV